jgi:hypothetical protein
MTASNHEELRRPFPADLISRLPASKGRPALDYVNHAAVTDRLLKYAGDWQFNVLERFEWNTKCYVRVALTIDHVTREEYGEDVDPKTAISDALKRAAMRFGVGLDLWSKEDLGVEGQQDATVPITKRPSDPKPQSVAPSLGEGAGAAGPWGEAVQPIGVEGTASSEVHLHEWVPAPRDGWEMCDGCGSAQKVKVKR